MLKNIADTKHYNIVYIKMNDSNVHICWFPIYTILGQSIVYKCYQKVLACTFYLLLKIESRLTFFFWTFLKVQMYEGHEGVKGQL